MTKTYHTRVLPERTDAAPTFRRRAGGRGEEQAPSSSSRRLTLCSDAADFLEWMEEALPSVLGEEVSLQSLDGALMMLTKEYLYRRQTTPLHEDPPIGRVGFLCLPEVYHHKATELFSRQLQLLRSVSFTPDVSPKDTKPQEVPRQHLYIGETRDEE